MTAEPLDPGHRVSSVVVNARHVWECRYCGRRWNPDVPHRTIEAIGCPSRSPVLALTDQEPRGS